jgi:sugar phosphate isomerase/epimerase
MKISVSTVAFPHSTLEEWPILAAGIGAEGLAVGCAANGPLKPEASGAGLREFSARCEDAGIAISAVYGYAGRGILAADPATRAQDIDLAKRCIDIAAQLNCRVARLFAWQEPPSDDSIDRFVEKARPIADHAVLAGVKLGIPTHHDLAFDAHSCRRLIDGFGADRAAIIFNGQSMEMDGIDPLGALRSMRDIIGQVELKDWQRRNGECVPAAIGTGDATVFPVVDELAALDFQGWLTLHHLRQHHPELPPLGPEVSAAVRTRIQKIDRRLIHVR